MPGIGTGTALIIRDRKLGPHLYFVLTDPDGDHRVVTVLLVTAKRHTDRTTMLLPGDHPFVRHESHVDYGTAKFIPVSRLSDGCRVSNVTSQRTQPCRAAFDRKIVSAC